MFKEFDLPILFDISTTKSVDKNKLDFVDDGEYDFIGRTSVDWGIQGKLHKLSFEPNPKDSFSLIQVGETVALWREREWYASQNLFLLNPRIDEIKENNLYFQGAINKEMSRYGKEYNSYPTMKSLAVTKIILPVIENSNPDHEYTADDIDWQYMHDYITELERDRITELDAYLQATGLNDCKLTEDDKKVLSEKVDVKSFSIGTVFEPLKVGFTGGGQKIGSATKEPDEEHCIPLTCAKIGDNGIMYWGKKGDFITYTNTLSVIADGAVSAGLVYAQPEETGAYSHSYFIDTKAKNVSKYAKTYLSSVLTKVIYPKYSREDAPRWNKIENDIIYLPITSDGEPDFDYMERYIRAMEKVVIADVVKYKDAVVNATKSLVNK